MPPTAKDYTRLLEEVKKAKKASDYLLDFIDLIKSNSDLISGDTGKSSESIIEACHNIHSSVDEITSTIFEDLNKIEIDENEIKDAGEKFLLYQNKEQVLIWSEQQKANHEENSYWWKYWQAIHDYMSTRVG
ncbi:MAG: hypothetical protein ACR2NW_10625 [Thermodesulfobacteriota bacterium]